MTDVLPSTAAVSNGEPDPKPASDSDVGWTRVCPAERLDYDRGVAAWVDGQPIAIFRLSPLSDDSVDAFVAVDHTDPRTGTPTMARGLIGSHGLSTTLAAPLYKERYDVRTGECLDNPRFAIGVHDVRVLNGYVEVQRNVMPEKPRRNNHTTDSDG